ncbi:hypothetical protein GX408_05390 [bacterium]|nr:hypothetical protein [bacterium]
MQIIRKIMFAGLVLALSTAIYALLVDLRGIKRSVLRPTLDELGARLYAAVAEDAEKEALKRRYAEFVRKAERQEIPSPQIERMAADILNLSAADSVVSSRDALSLLFMPPPAFAAEPSGKPNDIPPPGADIRIHINTPPQARPDVDELADRLQRLQTFHDEYKKWAQKDRAYRALRSSFAFTADSGLRVMVNPKLKTYMDRESFEVMNRELASLERKQLLVWQPGDSLHSVAVAIGPDSTLILKVKNAPQKRALFAPPSPPSQAVGH